MSMDCTWPTPNWAGYEDLDRRFFCVISRRTAMDELFRERSEIVFHAAAYKHVPLLEDQVREAVRNVLVRGRQSAQSKRKLLRWC